MTRAKRKANLKALKHALGEPNKTFSDHNKPPNIDPDIQFQLPDSYIYEGKPDKDLLNLLKELNINDIVKHKLYAFSFNSSKLIFFAISGSKNKDKRFITLLFYASFNLKEN